MLGRLGGNGLFLQHIVTAGGGRVGPVCCWIEDLKDPRTGDAGLHDLHERPVHCPKCGHTQNQKIIRGKIGVLELAKQLGNLSQACKMMGFLPSS